VVVIRVSAAVTSPLYKEQDHPAAYSSVQSGALLYKGKIRKLTVNTTAVFN